MRLRHLGLAFERTLFVVLCHGTRRWIAEMSRKTRVLPGALSVSVLEQAGIELADVAVCPSAYVLEWMEAQSWRLPEDTRVIPFPTRSGAIDETPRRRIIAEPNDSVERIAFFGRLEERKGVTPFVAGVNALEPELLRGIEL